VAGQGAAMGTFATGFSVLALWGIIRMTEPVAREESGAKWATIAVVLAFFVKLPVFVLMAQAANAMPAPAATYFLGGLALVYSLLVGRVLALR